MSESRSHKMGKGSARRTEVPIRGRRRLDAIRGHFAIEVERSGTDRGLSQALARLRAMRNKKKILRVPEHDIKRAIELARKRADNVTVTNLSKTKRRAP